MTKTLISEDAAAMGLAAEVQTTVLIQDSSDQEHRMGGTINGDNTGKMTEACISMVDSVHINFVPSQVWEEDLVIFMALPLTSNTGVGRIGTCIHKEAQAIPTTCQGWQRSTHQHSMGWHHSQFKGIFHRRQSVRNNLRPPR